MLFSIAKWAALAAAERVVKKYAMKAYDWIVDEMMAVWGWLCEKVESVTSWFKSIVDWIEGYK